MNRFSSLLFCSLIVLTTAAASEFGTAAEARAMLDRAVAALKADEAKAIEAFRSGSKDFKDRDLYVFCADSEGNFTAHPTLMGQNMKDLKDQNGKAVGEEMMAKAKEGQVATVRYVWPRPGSDTPLPKETFVTRVADQLCGVGHYKQP